MSKTITDKKRIEEVLTRGVEKIFPEKKVLEEALLAGKRLRIYCGYDPTAASLHLGNAISINKLAQFQSLGHEIIFLIGDFTGTIGDPTGKIAARKKLTQEEVRKNSENYQKQASKYLNFDGANPARLRYNSEWNAKLSFEKLLEIGANFTVQQMFQRDMFQERVKNDKPIYLPEFLYPLVQAYDSVALDVDLEIGGNDQMFNMLCGRDLLKALRGKDKFVLTLKLLADEEGKKMGKSEGNVVNLDETAENMFGQIMTWPDSLIGLGFELCTNLSLPEVEQIKRDLKDLKTNPRDLKLRLALEITKINQGTKEAQAAQDYFVKTFSKKELPKNIQEFRVDALNIKLTELLVKSGHAQSLSDARRKIEQGGVEINGEKITNWQTLLDKESDHAVLKIGKFGFIKIIF